MVGISASRILFAVVAFPPIRNIRVANIPSIKKIPNTKNIIRKTEIPEFLEILFTPSVNFPFTESL